MYLFIFAFLDSFAKFTRSLKFSFQVCFGFSSDEGSFDIPLRSQTISTPLKSLNLALEIFFLINDKFF